MKRKKAVKEGGNNKVKRNVQAKKKTSGRQHKEEIISKEELNDRGGICGDTTYYLTMHLIIFFDGYVIYHHSKKLIDLAQFIYNLKTLYIPKHGGYKLMELSSIITELAALKKSVEEKYEQEKEEKRRIAEKLKSKF